MCRQKIYLWIMRIFYYESMYRAKEVFVRKGGYCYAGISSAKSLYIAEQFSVEAYGVVPKV